MKILSINIKALIITLFIICTVSKADSPVSDIAGQLDSIEKKLDWIHHRLTLEQWEFHVNGVSDSLDFYQDLYRYLLANSDLFKNIPVRLVQVKNNEQKHRLQLLLARLLPDRVRFKPEILNLSDSLNGLFTDFSSELQGQMLPLTKLNKTYRTSRNRSERENAFRAANAVGDKVSYGMSMIFQLRNKEADKFGYQNYFDMIASQTPLGTKSILQLIYKLDSLTQEHFTTISGNALKTVGVNELELWDLDYTHFQINQRADDFFNFDQELRVLDSVLERMGFEVEQLPIYYTRNSGADDLLTENVFEIRAPYDVRIILTETNRELRIRQLLKTTGQALYSVHIAEDKRVYNFMAQKTWQMAMSEIMVLLAIDSLWLNDFANMPVGFIRQYRKARYEQELIEVRMLLLNLHFEYEAYLNPDQDLNRLYWDILQKYTGLPRHEDITVWASNRKFLNSPLNSMNQLLAKIIAAQSVNYMNDYLGQPVDDLRTSAFLIQNYYRFGSRYSWTELLERGTGEKLNPEHLVSHFRLSN
ncbi:MAG: hypothetical protein IH931_02820 [candidate division Zixibacteria bacterium]|nr:hypothetical protein [candidate division Zixibacteria bacterium]